VKLPAEARTKKTAADVAERLNADEGRREEDRPVGIAFPTDSPFLPHAKQRSEKWQTNK
jgi:hypothetical protein